MEKYWSEVVGLGVLSSHFCEWRKQEERGWYVRLCSPNTNRAARNEEEVFTLAPQRFSPSPSYLWVVVLRTLQRVPGRQEGRKVEEGGHRMHSKMDAISAPLLTAF
jgi:hypothetical protein